MLIDEIEIKFRAGHGGAGKVAFYPGKVERSSGGNGGKGGDLYIVGTSDITALRQFTKNRVLFAENGSSGDVNKKIGKDGRDLEIKMPVGTFSKETKTGEEIEVKMDGEKILVCRGGKGGRGNYELRFDRSTPAEFAQPGLKGEEKHFQVFLKLIADFGLIGLPNAGKSSLLNELTQANVKTAAYPFTTIEPNLGALDGKVIADIPGLIEGASSGKGLGIKFLKHIEKTKMLLHCVAADSENVVYEVSAVLKELENYNPELAKKEQIILLTKSDLVSESELEKKFRSLKKFKKPIYTVSIHDFEAIEKLKKILI